jgi:hypothetical protein
MRSLALGPPDTRAREAACQPGRLPVALERVPRPRIERGEPLDYIHGIGYADLGPSCRAGPAQRSPPNRAPCASCSVVRGSNRDGPTGPTPPRAAARANTNADQLLCYLCVSSWEGVTVGGACLYRAATRAASGGTCTGARPGAWGPGLAEAPLGARRQSTWRAEKEGRRAGRACGCHNRETDHPGQDGHCSTRLLVGGNDVEESWCLFVSRAQRRRSHSSIAGTPDPCDPAVPAAAAAGAARCACRRSARRARGCGAPQRRLSAWRGWSASPGRDRCRCGHQCRSSPATSARPQ